MGEISFHATMIKKELTIIQNIHIMINKELSEILDALTRENGDSMPPCKELELLGFDPFGRLCSIKECASYGESDEEDDDTDNSSEEYIDEEYDYDEADDQYTLLTQVLRLYNCRKKYFA